VTGCCEQVDELSGFIKDSLFFFAAYASVSFPLSVLFR
jgi:hypothetical protein